MKIMVDISGEALKRAGFSFDELEPLIELGVTGLRMDYGITIEQMAHASHKIDIGLNASTITLEEVAELKAHQADFSRLEACIIIIQDLKQALEQHFLMKRTAGLKN